LSRLFEALSRLEAERRFPKVAPQIVPPSDKALQDTTPQTAISPNGKKEAEAELRSLKLVLDSPEPAPIVTSVSAVPLEADKVPSRLVETLPGRSVSVNPSPESRLVALTAPNSLGAEKFRALVTRLDHMAKQGQLKSLQVTSSVINEGKTLVAGNLAVTLAKYSGAKTLLIEGDLHRPTLASLFGLTELSGLTQWWSGRDQELTPFLHRVNDTSLWFLSAGKPCERPSDIIRSARFAKAFTQLASQFEWIVVDSTPMAPIVDVNLWSKLVDGALLVVREGQTPAKALKKGLQALDHPKLIGVVMNEASGSDHGNYDGQYYGVSNPRAGRFGK
jgi:capsular exopolysaccharide synthesis family protein